MNPTPTANTNDTGNATTGAWRILSGRLELSSTRPTFWTALLFAIIWLLSALLALESISGFRSEFLQLAAVTTLLFSIGYGWSRGVPNQVTTLILNTAILTLIAFQPAMVVVVPLMIPINMLGLNQFSFRCLGAYGVALIAYLLLSVSPYCRVQFVEAFRHTSDIISGAINGRRMHGGPSALGGWSALYLSLIVFCLAEGIWRKVGLTIALIVGYLIFMCIAVGMTKQYGMFHIAVFGWAANGASLLTLALGAILIVLGGRSNKDQTSPGRLQSIGLGLAVGVAVLLLVSVTLICFFPKTDETRGEVAFLEDACFVDFKMPTPESKGLGESGMFGAALGYVETLGYQSRRIKLDELDSDEFQADTLFIINPQADWSEQQLDRIQSFVRSGGSLIVLGDHTDILGTQDSLNKLCSPFGVRYRFDSAYPLRNHWADSIHISDPWTCRSSIPDSAFSISIGASLEITDPQIATPLLYGQYGFSDAGNRNNEQAAFLGDYLYRFGEPIGDVVLASKTRFGKGRVVVFGDTSSFQNVAIANTGLDFLPELFDEITTTRRYGQTTAPVLLVLILFVAIAVPHTRPTAILVSALCLLITHSRPTQRSHTEIVKSFDANHVMVVSDLLNHFDNGAQTERGVYELIFSLYASKKRPFLSDMQTALSLDQGTIVIVAPRQSPDKHELRQLKSFVERGGTLLLAMNRDAFIHSPELADEFGFAISQVPLGPYPLIARANESRPQFLDAWALDLKSDTDWQVLFAAEGLPVVARKDIGDGYVTVIGDEEFLLGQSMVQLQTLHARNLSFLGELISQEPESLANAN